MAPNLQIDVADRGKTCELLGQAVCFKDVVRQSESPPSHCNKHRHYLPYLPKRHLPSPNMQRTFRAAQRDLWTVKCTAQHLKFKKAALGTLNAFSVLRL
jgi:hypothetical protein